jgi:hypothetical protein
VERPALSAIAVALGRVLDGPAVACKPAAAKQPVETLKAMRPSAVARVPARANKGCVTD